MYKITLGVDGMMCGMCEAHVNDNIRKNFKVKKVNSSRSKKETVIIAKEEIPEDKLKETVKESGYEVTSYICEPYEKKGLFK